MGGGSARSRSWRSGRTCAHADGSGSSSSSDSEVEDSPFVGRYTGYTLARSMGAGTRLCSDVFEVGGQLFRIEVYPAGLNLEAQRYVSLYLTTPGTVRPEHLLYECSIVDKGRSKPQHITEARTAALPLTALPPTQSGVLAGFPKFIKANFLHRNARRFLQDDILTIRATVKMLTGRSSFPMEPLMLPPPPLPLHAAYASGATASAFGPVPSAYQPPLQPAPCSCGGGSRVMQYGQPVPSWHGYAQPHPHLHSSYGSYPGGADLMHRADSAAAAAGMGPTASLMLYPSATSPMYKSHGAFLYC
ncbi:BTB/POZ and MATH domain-containing protein 6 [Tetrabaena socialis]|uniref:BTB/POZ and MATH domain-containing protein 6 n=1 Tax=Tetrabaena socialis TaxID=47790 RepID=A0A2J8AI76_9CHLO|nr:BTB/POZ and MATH domain-containing protein 6 [Tetrabaena socialis]|eukprot:PNH12211.1 BTB/POZ and MATH domain-containing protein 6 [Tetrabaena socialis]